jgi:hypothetical protein
MQPSFSLLSISSYISFLVRVGRGSVLKNTQITI